MFELSGEGVESLREVELMATVVVTMLGVRWQLVVGRLLASLKGQDTKRWELIVVGEGEAALEKVMAEAHVPDCPVRLLSVPPGTSVGAARNVARRLARSDCLIFLDGDTTVSPDYVRSMASRLEGDHVVCSRFEGLDFERLSGETDSDTGNPHLRWQFYPAASRGTLGISVEAFDDAGGYDERLTSSSAADADLSFRLGERGYRIVPVPTAEVTYQDPSSLRCALRDGFRMGQGDVALYKRWRPRGLSAVAPREQLDQWRRTSALAAGVKRGLGRSRLAGEVGLRAGRLTGSVRHRTVLL